MYPSVLYDFFILHRSTVGRYYVSSSIKIMVEAISLWVVPRNDDKITTCPADVKLLGWFACGIVVTK